MNTFVSAEVAAEHARDRDTEREHGGDGARAEAVMARLEIAIAQFNALVAEMKEIDGLRSFTFYGSLGPAIRLEPDVFEAVFGSDPLVKEKDFPAHGYIERTCEVDGVRVLCEAPAKFTRVRL